MHSGINNYNYAVLHNMRIIFVSIMYCNTDCQHRISVQTGFQCRFYRSTTLCTWSWLWSLHRPAWTNKTWDAPCYGAWTTADGNSKSKKCEWFPALSCTTLWRAGKSDWYRSECRPPNYHTTIYQSTYTVLSNTKLVAKIGREQTST